MAKTKKPAVMSQRSKDVLRAAIVAAFGRAAEDPRIKDFGDACCVVMGAIEYLADPELDVVALWRGLQVDRALDRVSSQSLSDKLAKLSTLADDVRQLTIAEVTGREMIVQSVSVLSLVPPLPDNHDHDRELCDCGDCENWRRAEETHA